MIRQKDNADDVAAVSQVIKTLMNNAEFIQCSYTLKLGLDKDKHSLFGEHRAGLEKVAAERCSLVGGLWWCCGTLQVQTADDDVEDSCHGCQLHAIEHGGQLRADGVHVTVLEGRHRGHGRGPICSVLGKLKRLKSLQEVELDSTKLLIKIELDQQILCISFPLMVLALLDKNQISTCKTSSLLLLFCRFPPDKIYIKQSVKLNSL